jgi:hypothetical protein
MRIDATQLRQRIVELFSEEELRTLAVDLSLDLDDLPGEGREARARELVAWAERMDRTDDLVEQMRRARPGVQIVTGRRVLMRRRRPVRVESDDMADGFTLQQAQLDRLSATMEEIRKATAQIVTQTALLEQRLANVERRLDAIEGRQVSQRLTWTLMVVIVALIAALIWAMLRG